MKSTLLIIALAIAAAVFLSACGGGDDPTRSDVLPVACAASGACS